MKTLSKLIDSLLHYAVSWLGSPVHGLPETIEVDRQSDHCEPETRPARGRMRFAHP